MANLENDNFDEQHSEHHMNGSLNEEEPALTIRALVSTKEAGVIIGKGK